MTRSPSAPIVRIERVIDAPPDRVFAAWIDPDRLSQWMSPVGHAVAEVQPWVGGRLSVTMIGDGVRIEHDGEFREVVPDRRLVFTWRSRWTGPEPSLVTVQLEPSGAGTVLTLVHERLPTDRVESHRNGWWPMLGRLADLLTDPENGGL